jgi:Putative metallopeptidase
MVVCRFLVIFLALIWALALAQDNGDFVVAYEDSTDQVQLEYKNWLEGQEFLENLIKDFNATIALPQDIGVVGAECGDANAYWDPNARAMIVCYELFGLMDEMFRDDASSPEELDSEMLGATRFIFYHELGHAMIDIFGIPYTGREEDAVDQFSTILLLNGNEVASALAGANFFYKFASSTELEQLVFWDEHSLDEQRFYDIVCLVYGSDPETYDNLLQRDAKGFLLSTDGGILPKERGERCPEEYKDISSSWNTLISSYVPSIDGSDVPAINTQSDEPVVTLADAVNTTAYAESFSGTLESGDDTLDDGEYFDYYEVELLQGQEVTFELSSADFDTYLVVSAPDDFGYVNDDSTINVDGYLSKLTIPISITGTWRIGVSSYEKDQSGNYTVGVVKYDSIYNEVLPETLADGDSTYETGEFVDSYDYTFEAGQNATVVLSSLDFDPYLVVTTPSGETIVNDDYENQFGMARVDFEATESGVYTISATTYETGETGAYQIAISNVGASQDTVEVLEAGTYELNSENFDFQEGALEPGDTTFKTEEYFDTFSYDLINEGQTLTITLTSLDFDAFLMAESPSGETFSNDDYADGSTLARLDLPITETGTWTFYVTSSKPNETGLYEFTIMDIGDDTETSSPDPSNPEMFSDFEFGTLEDGDSTFETNEYYDVFSYDLSAGQSIVARLESDVFNTFIMAVPPTGDPISNDDEEDGVTNSLLTLDITQAGTWDFYITSSQVGETGDYVFTIADAATVAGMDTAPADDQSTQEPVIEESSTEINPDVTVTDMTTTKARSTNMGALASGDNTLEDGSYVDYYTVDLQAGQEASFGLVSADFETYIGVMKPSGELLELDEQQDASRSRITLNVEETGTWFVFVTSVSAGEEGNYLLSIKK